MREVDLAPETWRHMYVQAVSRAFILPPGAERDGLVALAAEIRLAIQYAGYELLDRAPPKPSETGPWRDAETDPPPIGAQVVASNGKWFEIRARVSEAGWGAYGSPCLPPKWWIPRPPGSTS